VYIETTFHDAAEQEASLPGWEQEYRQVSTGGYSGRLSAMLLSNVQILRETISVGTEQLFSAPEGSLIFYHYPRSDRTELVRGERVFMASGFALNWQDRVGFMDADSDLLMVVLSRNATAVDRHGSGNFVGPPPVQAAFLAEWMLSLLALGRNSVVECRGQEAESLLADMINDRFDLLFQQCALCEIPRLVNGERIYKKIRDRLYDSPDRPHTVQSLSRDLGIPSSTLRSACYSFAKIPLDQTLTLLRLNGARRDLIGAGGSARKVSDVAMDWGFFHWGRFALRYRTLFGETPSQTIRDSRLD
jgi:AraC family transcriptional regulator, ethanolamine operon transcriptional activator